MSTEAVRIDAHHHLWDLAVRDQSWTVDLPVLRRSFTMADLGPALQEGRIDGTILVETINVAPETPEFLAIAAANPTVRGVVGWVDLTDPAVADRLAELRELPGGDRLVGIRHQVQGEPDPQWLIREDVIRGLQAVAAADLAYDLLVLPHQLPAAIEATRRVEGMRWVLDHSAKPPIASGDLEPWAGHLATLASVESVTCKLSGLVTEAPEQWCAEDIRPYAAHVLDVFGPDRVMFGSDWPVCLLRASYGDVVDLAAELIDGLSPDEQASVWGGTAIRAYRLGG